MGGGGGRNTSSLVFLSSIRDYALVKPKAVFSVPAIVLQTTADVSHERTTKDGMCVLLLNATLLWYLLCPAVLKQESSLAAQNVLTSFLLRNWQEVPASGSTSPILGCSCQNTILILRAVT